MANTTYIDLDKTKDYVDSIVGSVNSFCSDKPDTKTCKTNIFSLMKDAGFVCDGLDQYDSNVEKLSNYMSTYYSTVQKYVDEVKADDTGIETKKPSDYTYEYKGAKSTTIDTESKVNNISSSDMTELSSDRSKLNSGSTGAVVADTNVGNNVVTANVVNINKGTGNLNTEKSVSINVNKVDINSINGGMAGGASLDDTNMNKIQGTAFGSITKGYSVGQSSLDDSNYKINKVLLTENKEGNAQTSSLDDSKINVTVQKLTGFTDGTANLSSNTNTDINTQKVQNVVLQNINTQNKAEISDDVTLKTQNNNSGNSIDNPVIGKVVKNNGQTYIALK